MKNEKELKGQELVDFLMIRFNMTEDEALQNLAENIGNKKLEIGKDPIPFPIKFPEADDLWNDIVYIQPPIK
jgi:hypothetical protein|tara:strand:- start:497 stop:712 length:216 start_codon:yes stop_codon:yes gene_type:complete